LNNDPLNRALAALQRHLLPFLFLLYVIAYLDRVNVSFAAAGVSKDLGLNSASYGFAAGIFFLGYVLFEVPSNLVLDRVGARRWISRILLSWGVVAALMAFMTTAAQFNGLRLLLGVAEAGFFPGIILYLSQWVPEAQRARTLAGFMLAIPVAGLLGGPVSAALLSIDGFLGLAGWRWLFLLEALPAIVLSVAVWRWLPNRPAQARWLKPDEAEALEEVLQTERAQSLASAGQVHGLGALWGDRRLWLLSVLYLGIATSFYGFSFWIPRFVGDALGQSSPSAVLVNLLSAIPYGLAVVVMVLVGRAADRHADKRLFVAVPLAVAALALVLSLPAEGGLRLVLISIATAAAFSSLGPAWAMPLQFLGGRAAAGGIAAINSFGNIGGFLAPFVMGQLMLRPHGDSLALASLAGVLLVAALLALLASRRPEDSVAR
jgi:ACS family tartrate transporter-like MFS transporter